MLAAPIAGGLCPAQMLGAMLPIRRVVAVSS